MHSQPTKSCIPGCLYLSPSDPCQYTSGVLPDEILPSFVKKEDSNSKSERQENVFNGYTLSYQLDHSVERKTYPSQEGILEERNIAKEEEESQTGEHCRRDPPVPSA